MKVRMFIFLDIFGYKHCMHLVIYLGLATKTLLFFLHCSCEKEIAWLQMSRVMRKSDFCLCQNKSADQLYSNCAVTAQLIRAFVSTISLIYIQKFKHQYCSVNVQAGVCQTLSTRKPRRQVFSHRCSSVITMKY